MCILNSSKLNSELYTKGEDITICCLWQCCSMGCRRLPYSTWGHHWVMLATLGWLHCLDCCSILIWSCITSGVTADIYNSCNQNKEECSLIQFSLIRHSPGPDSFARVCKSLCAMANFGGSVNVRRLVLLCLEHCLLESTNCWQSSLSSAMSSGWTPSTTIWNPIMFTIYSRILLTEMRDLRHA